VPGAVVDGEWSSGRVSAGEPGLGEGVGGGVAPQGEHPRHARGKQRGEGLRGEGCVGGECGGGAALDRRSFGEIDAEASDDPVAAALEQDARELGPPEEQVIGPFELERRAGSSGVERFDQGQPAGEGQARCGWVVGLELD